MVKRQLTKRVSTRFNGATVYIHAPQIGKVGQIAVDIVNGDEVKISVRREDVTWFGSVNIELI